MCETLGAADALITDYSAVAFDAAYMELPVFEYVYDLQDYIGERGRLLFDLDDLPFPYGEDMDSLCGAIESFDEASYARALEELWQREELLEDGRASERIVDLLEDVLDKGGRADAG